MTLILEIFVCACESGGRVRYAVFRFDITDRRCDPDQIVSEKLLDTGLRAEDACCFAHSTSWRYEAGKTLITYLVWSTRCHVAQLQTRVLDPGSVALPAAAGRLQPRPVDITEESVLVHGLQHFCFLLQNRQAASFGGTHFSEDLLAVIDHLAPAVAGRFS